MTPNPQDELVDVIDAEGRTIGTVTRRQMREQKLPHRCTYLLVFNRCGELFLHLRTPTKDVYPSYWDVCVGGVLAAGESFDTGARRELQEELRLSIDAADLRLLGAVRALSGGRTQRHVAIVFEWRAATDDVAVALSSAEFFERRGTSLSGSFVDVSDLARDIDSGRISEPWSTEIVRHLLPDVGRQITNPKLV